MRSGSTARPRPTSPFASLARAYAVSDAWYSSTPTQTNPNRAFIACGTSLGLVNNDSSGIDKFGAPTIWNRLSDLGKSWRIYWENAFPPDTDNHPWTRQCFTQLGSFGSEYFPRMAAFHRDAKLGRLPFFSFIEPSWTLETSVGAGQGHRAQPRLGRLEGFQGNDLHPPGDIRPGLQFLSAIYSSLVSNQAAWARTLLLITFDEHGGTFDHVPPPDDVTPDQTHASGSGSTAWARASLLVSPMVQPGTVFRSTKARSNGRSYPYDHTSIPATILKLAGAKPEQYGLTIGPRSRRPSRACFAGPTIRGPRCASATPRAIGPTRPSRAPMISCATALRSCCATRARGIPRAGT